MKRSADYSWWESGPYVGRGPRNYRRSDQDVQRDVCNRLAANGRLDAREIEVSVDGHIVTLKGMVGSRRSKILAEDIAESVMSVGDVRNELRIQRQGQANAPQGQATAAQSVSSRPLNLRDGQQVIGPKGKDIGTVKEIHAQDFVLNRPSAPDVHVPFSAIEDTTENQVMLNVPADQIDNQHWGHLEPPYR